MKWKSVSNRLNYGNLFEGWEMAIARALVRGFCGAKKAFPTDDFDDRLQDVLIHWLSKRDTYDPAGGASQRTYMRRVVRNKLIELTEKRRTQKRKTLDKATSLENPQGEDEGSPSFAKTRQAVDPRSTERIKLKAYLSLTVENLTARQKTILELKATGLTNKEISRELGVHRDTVQADIRRIRELFEDAGLREYL